MRSNTTIEKEVLTSVRTTKLFECNLMDSECDFRESRSTGDLSLIFFILFSGFSRTYITKHFISLALLFSLRRILLQNTYFCMSLTYKVSFCGFCGRCLLFGESVLFFCILFISDLICSQRPVCSYADDSVIHF